MAVPRSPSSNDADRRATDGPPTSGRELINQLVAAEGHLHIPAPDRQVRASYRRCIWQVHNEVLTPPDRTLRYSGRDRGELHIWLENQTKPEPPGLTVPVPERLTRPHPLVAATREALRTAPRDEQRRRSTSRVPEVFDVRVTDAHRSRALRLLQGLVTALLERGHDFGVPRPSGHRYHQDRNVRVHIGEHTYNLKLYEQLDPEPHQLTPKEREHLERGWGRTPPKYDYTASGRLQIELDSFRTGRRRSWSDTTRWTLDDKLGEVILELEARAELDEQRAEEHRRLEAERQRAYQQQLDRTRTRMRTEHLQKQLADQADAWQRAATIRAYSDALQDRIDTEGDVDTEVRDWLSWARKQAGTLDPLTRDTLPAMPELPPISDQQAEEFLRASRLQAAPRTLYGWPPP